MFTGRTNDTAALLSENLQSPMSVESDPMSPFSGDSNISSPPALQEQADGVQMMNSVPTSEIGRY